LLAMMAQTSAGHQSLIDTPNKNPICH